MTAKVFVDTNILIYAHDSDAGEKQRRASAVLRRLWLDGNGRLSTQVLQEFYVNVTKKLVHPLTPAEAREMIRAYATWIHQPLTASSVLRASEAAEVYRISFWDSLVLVGAEQEGASILLSEDFHDGQRFAGVQVVNPFRNSAWAENLM